MAGRVTIIAIIAGVFWTAVLGYTIRKQGDPRALLIAGSGVPRPASMADVPAVASKGYDGQMYAVLATDPLLLQPDTPSFLDTPEYRAQRLALPLAAWILAGGNQRSAVIIYQGLCWILALLPVVIISRMLEEEGRSPWWALFSGISGGVVSSILSSLPDAAAIGLALVAILMRSKNRRGWLPLLCFSCLVRETSIIFAIALAVVELRERNLRGALATTGIPALLLAAVRLWLFFRLGSSHGGAARNFSFPFSWLDELPFSPLHSFGLIVMILAIAGAGFALRRVADAINLSFAGFALLALFSAWPVYEAVWNYSRVFVALPMLATILGERAKNPDRWLFRSVNIGFSIIGVALLISALP